MNITYYRENKYGNELWYPVSNDAKLVCRLMQTKTLTELAFIVLKQNGASFEEVLKPRSEVTA